MQLASNRLAGGFRVASPCLARPRSHITDASSARGSCRLWRRFITPNRRLIIFLAVDHQVLNALPGKKPDPFLKMVVIEGIGQHHGAFTERSGLPDDFGSQAKPAL